MKNLEKKPELKSGRTLKVLKLEDRKAYYKVQSLSAKLNELKAGRKGNFITKAHLSEFKPLIIWILKNKVNFQGHLNLKNAMTILLNKVETENITFKTKKGIKGIVSNLAISAGLQDVESNFRNANGFTILDNTYGNKRLEALASHRINVSMNS